MTSEKTLMIVAVIAVIVAALAMIFAYITNTQFDTWLVGLAPPTNVSTGIVNVTIVQNLVVNFSMDKIIWGRGSVDAGQLTATLDSASSVSAVNGNWNRSVTTIGTTPGEGDGVTTPSGFVLNNIGNINANLYLRTDKNATQFLPGTVGGGPVYQYNVSDGTTSGCASANRTITFGSYINVNTTAPLGTKVCNQFVFTPGSSVRVDIKLVIPNDVLTSNTPRTSNMIATAELS